MSNILVREIRSGRDVTVLSRDKTEVSRVERGGGECRKIGLRFYVCFPQSWRSVSSLLSSVQFRVA